MLRVTMTPNLLGIKISGTYDDLNALYDAIWEHTIADEDFPEDTRMHGTVGEQGMSTRLLALNYDIRHAYQGDRNIELIDSGMNEWSAEYHDLPHVKQNVEYSVEVLYPEAMFEMVALSYLVDKRTRALGNAHLAVLEESICQVRLYQSKVIAAVKEAATRGRYARICRELCATHYDIPAMCRQWIDVINNDYTRMTKRQRAESLSTVVRDIVGFACNEEYLELESVVTEYAASYRINRDDVVVSGLNEWDEPEW